ncbi:MAG: (deoxy)nucleoside triphosphate pyrophosphohydrolase [Acidobacteriota bacterium]|nr:(deoxy)nucleoside triphosphate pyrophosphohydrolase [Acidobacteriota bacterium]
MAGSAIRSTDPAHCFASTSRRVGWVVRPGEASTTTESRAVDPVEIALAVPIRDGLVLVTQRGADQRLAGLWEFPGGKIEDGEIPSEAAGRELREETGLQASTLDPLTIVVHDDPDTPLRFHVFLARDPVGEVCTDGGRPWDWVDPAGLADLKMPEANRQILRALRWRS